MRATAMAVLLGAVTPIVAAEQATPAPTAVPVGVVTAEKKAVTRSLDFVGRVEAIQRVEVKARITGYLEKVEFKDPMYVTFPVSQREFLEAQKAGRSVDITGIKASLYFADGSPYKHSGKINFVDVTVDRATDTVLARATFPNPDFALVDGQFVRLALASNTTEERIVIPQAALISDQQGVYVFIVDQGKAAVRRVKPGGPSGTGIIIEEGLTGGEQVVVEGIQGLRADVPVSARPVVSSPVRS